MAGFPEMYSAIRTLRVKGSKVIRENRAQKFLDEGREVKAPTDGNQKILAVTDGGAASLAARIARLWSSDARNSRPTA